MACTASLTRLARRICTLTLRCLRRAIEQQAFADPADVMNAGAVACGFGGRGSDQKIACAGLTTLLSQLGNAPKAITINIQSRVEQQRNQRNGLWRCSGRWVHVLCRQLALLKSAYGHYPGLPATARRKTAEFSPS
jgi:hypothetical protein